MTKVGDRVKIKAGMAHHGYHDGMEGTVTNIESPALEVLFDGETKPHRWYTDSEVEHMARVKESKDLAELLRESAREAIQEAGLSTAFSDGTERGAPAASGHYPPSENVENGGQTKTPPYPAGGAPGAVGEITQRNAPLSAGIGEFSSGSPAPRDFPSQDPGSASDHISAYRGNYSTPGPSEHVSESGKYFGVALLETVGFSFQTGICATCSHTKGHHTLAGMDGMCSHCAPKGSIHKFSETIDMTPKLMTVPLYPANPPDPGDVNLPTKAGSGSTLTESTYFISEPEMHRRMFTEVQQALIELDVLHEALLPWRGKSDIDEGGDVRKEQLDAARDRAETYNRHTVAAHRQTLAAYQSGNHSEHHVAEGHHSLAADAAEAAAGDYPDNHPAKRDYRIAAGYHKQQMQAHRHAANAAHRGAVPGRHDLAIDAPFHASY